ncbi:MAG: tetratricopeptide repeat protein [Desulfobacterales bacterium]|jgi:tetratricopeptide (TPR) repeat protein
MKFICPVCKTAGDIPEDDSVQPAVQTTCQKCGNALSIERGTGRAEALSADSRISGTRPKYETSSVLSMRPTDKGKKDYVAISTFSVILTILVATGVYFTLNLERGVFNKPLQTLSKMVEEVSQYGKIIFGEFQKTRRPEGQKAQRVKKHVRRGYDHYKEKRFKKAQDELSQAIEIDPENAEAYFWRARTFIRMGQYDEAIGDLKEVVDLNPRYSPAYDNLGWLLMRRNKYDESLTYLNKSIELKADNGWAHYMRSRIFFKKGDLQTALENAKTACKLDYKDACRDAKRYESQLAEQD